MHPPELKAIEMRNRSARSRQGTTAVEVAICLPVLFMFLFGCYELSRCNMLLHAAESAAYEGARVGIVPGATPEKIEDAVSFVLASVGAANFDVQITPATITSETEKVLVEVELDLGANTSMPQFFIKNSRLRGECELTRETL